MSGLSNLQSWSLVPKSVAH